MKTLVLALLTASAACAAAAQPPEHLDALEREMRIMKKVFAAALRDAEGPRARVGDVQVGYLAEQGVLIDVSLRRGWFGSYHRVVEIDADGDVSMAMPSMVRDILLDLEIPLGPIDAEEMEALREERRELNRERRELRGKLRELRRQAPLDDAGKAELEKLRGEQEALRAEHDALRADLRDQYAQVHVVRGTAGDGERDGDGNEREAGDASGENTPPAFDAALVGAICDYGPTLKSLPEDERLSVQVRHRGRNAFHVFTFADVLECAAGDLTPAELHEQAIVYATAGERRQGRHHRHRRHHGKGGRHGKEVFRWETAPD